MADQVRIFQLARKLGLRTQALLKVLAELGVEDVTAASSIDIETARAAAELLAEQAREAKQRAEEEAARAEAEAAEAAEAEAAEAEEEVVEAEEVPAEEEEEPEAEEYEVEEEEEEEEEYERFVPAWAAPESLRSLEEQLAELEEDLEEEEEEVYVPLPEEARRPSGERPENAIDVPPVVSVLGHVDHGKTTLLDALRETNVVDSESGGITQHIGASEVQVGEQTIVFVDTPGHAAFTAMRARGGQVADIVVLVVAADDAVMPQTVEAIGHARAAGVPIIVAINKTDLPGADPDLVKQELLEHELVAEDYGGDTIMVPISALQRENLADLLEMILLLAEVQELWADPDAPFTGVVVEAGMDESRGPVATVLVRNGEIQVGDVVICGTANGRVRRLNDWRGKSVKKMGPGHPVEVIGLSDVPEAGQIMARAESVKQAREVVAEREEQIREEQLEGTARASLQDLYRELGELEVKSLNLMLKADVWGSVQALEGSLMELDEQLEEVEITVIHTGVGDVTESDVLLAVASDAIILGFHVGVPDTAERTAEAEHVEIRTYDVIYEAIEDIQRAMVGMLEPIYEERVVGHGRVLQTFRISRVGVVAGTVVTDGFAQRGADMVVTRDGEVIYEGVLESLRHFDEAVRRIEAPNECGISTADFRGWQEGDEIEFRARVEVPRETSFESAR
ncbi:MAG: translation initiation factor IF-2 [Armatimonadota bacterium]|nr:translation initiation factor IF-2 [Armatimonadota bacterium]